MVAFCGRELASLPARLLWLFCYDYVIAPGVGRSWPSPIVYGSRYRVRRNDRVLRDCRGRRGRRGGRRGASRTAARAGVVLAVAAALALGWSVWLVDDFLIALSPHWSQKEVIAAYYRLRRGPEEPLIAWNLYWRGENLYTRNEIFSAPDPQRAHRVGPHRRGDSGCTSTCPRIAAAVSSSSSSARSWLRSRRRSGRTSAGR